MTFGPDHYVPVLKLKPGEKRALASLTPSLAARITPLFEVVEMGEKKSLADHLAASFKDLRDSVRAIKRYFLDAREIARAGAEGARGVFASAAALGLPFTPVTGIRRAADVDAALAYRKAGIAIRLTCEEFESGCIPAQLPRWLAAHDLGPEGVDLIVDLGAVDHMVASGVVRLSQAFLREVPDHRRWRTFTVSASSFPASMGVVERHSHALLDRIEWQAWRDELHANRATLARVPTFSDSAVQHPLGVERFNFRTMQVSPSVRYTLHDQWLLIKGESGRNMPPGAQFPSLAKRLVYGHLSGHFSGATHCQGCTGIQRAADGGRNYGSATAWRRLATIHHLTRAIEQIAALPWP